MSSGITYAKINKKDVNGVDNTITFQGLNDFILVLSDHGPTRYNIINRTEYPDYFLLK